SSQPGFGLVPDYLTTLNDPSGKAIQLAEPVPVWTFKLGSTFYKFLAGDADGDGIADSAFVKLPVGEINGVTYYAAIRIIDNNSAQNANTAMTKSLELDG